MSRNDITIGKRRGLASTSDKGGIFHILALDHRQSFVNMVTSDTSPDMVYKAAASAKLEVIKRLSSPASAVLLDPLYGAPQVIEMDVLSGGTGLLVAVEKSGYAGQSTARESMLLPGWGVDKTKRMGADAVKLLLYYHPDSGSLAERQEQLVLDVVESCQQEDILFFLEPIIYSLDPDIDKESAEFSAIRTDVVTSTTKRLSALNPDVLKLEFPVDAQWNQNLDDWLEACQAVTDASSCPWTVLSAGVDFDIFQKQVKVACQSGASGFIGGRAIWKEGLGMSQLERQKWLDTTARDRLETLCQVASEYGTPWQKYYPQQDFESFYDWYQNY